MVDMNEMKKIVQLDWPNAIFLDRESWFSYLFYPEQREHYEPWIDNNDCCLYLIQYEQGSKYRLSLGARYGLKKGEYLSPYTRCE